METAIQDYQTHIMSAKSITIICKDGSSLCVPKEDGAYNGVREALLNRRLNEAVELANRVTAVSKHSKNKFKVVDGIVQIDNKPLPDALSKRLMAFLEKGLSCEPLVNFWNNVKRNPNPRSREYLYCFLENKGIPLTEDGCFIGYKYVDSNFKDVRTHTFDNRPGKIVEMPREQCDSDPNVGCSRGLHIGTWDFVKKDGEHLVQIKCNPKDVVCVPYTDSIEKIRVCRYEVLAEISREGSMIEDLIYNFRTYYYKHTRRNEFQGNLVTSHKPSKFSFTCRAKTTEEAIKKIKSMWNKEN